MCLIAFALAQHPEYPLVVAANRDEFFQRPTAAMDWWPDQNLLAGRDLSSGGTWLAVSRDGRVAAVTNVREGSPEPGRVSRGELPVLALSGPDAIASQLPAHQHDYAGFNLLSLADRSGWYYSNRDAHPGRHIHRGVYGLSNHLLQSPWPKLLRLRDGFASTLRKDLGAGPQALHRDLIRLLQDDTPADDRGLPDTGVDIATERMLSSPFIRGEAYGTRATTIVSVGASGEILVTEQTWLPFGRPGEQRQFSWQRES